jgi:Zn-dependent M28 family amino/carboxypeptidase
VKKAMKRKKVSSKVHQATIKVNFHVKREDLVSDNVLAFLEGEDPELKSEIVVISAHYDHVGIINGEIHNGADDDGSGTVSVMEMARAFVQAKKEGHGSKRSILFLHVSGEEKGLLGSEWYSDHPVYPLVNTVCDLNVDMVGRKDADHQDGRYIYLIGSDKLSTELHQISEEANKKYTQLQLDYTYNDPNDPNQFYYRSDHYNFAKHNIPVIFYFSGVHEDYHKPGDDPEKIMYDKMAEIGKLVFHTAWEVANRPEKLKVDVTNDFKQK